MVCLRTLPVAEISGTEVWGDLVALPVFKTGVGLNKVPGGFDSHPPPPISTHQKTFNIQHSKSNFEATIPHSWFQPWVLNVGS